MCVTWAVRRTRVGPNDLAAAQSSKPAAAKADARAAAWEDSDEDSVAIDDEDSLEAWRVPAAARKADS